jgi:2,4-dienoyl-CoA reductase-like NADH-dependent reductase (Old Yellow Enzyme family)
VSPLVRAAVRTPLGAEPGFPRASAQAALNGVADAISFGRPFIANPDLPERLRTGASLAAPDPATFYTQGSEGYVDYAPLEEARRAA